MSFVLKKRVTFEDESQEWKDCYFDFAIPSYKQVRDLRNSDSSNENEMVDFLRLLFLGGKAFDGEKLVEIKPDQLEELPILIIKKCFEALASEIDPKKKEQ